MSINIFVVELKEAILLVDWSLHSFEYKLIDDITIIK